ncbi:hypothetical protein Psch_03523 [Pelotomaculum schinkii]|uniref:DUF1257 domain-containing protein n=1 Tax=Pelotomaculum schinkii TaxID=78350 RepID=A0A4Y7R7Z1_9FIRM|nr:DUF1257 domain-containing protein [Pelotomaculum schinkii]TEB04761.1 hypothetical protein Psch_03523 [Pelotomaculum schinkii]
MSHWTQVKTNIRDFDVLEEAAKSLGCEVSRNATARGYYENRIQAMMVIIPPESPYDVAANKEEDGNISLTTDWYMGHVEKVLGADFGLLKQRYSVSMAKRQASALLANVTEETLQDGSIRLKIRGAA